MIKFDSGFLLGSLKRSDAKAIMLPLEQNPDGEVECDRNITKSSSDQILEKLLSNLLKYGVIIASAIVLIGGILYLMHHGAELPNYRVFHGVPSEFRSPQGVVTAVVSGSRRGIIQLGLLTLIATPIIRVAVSLLTFLWQRDRVYIIVTLLVLSELIYGLVGAY
ncbi:DUF1634 domain-containing protein [Microseira wollei]|uniref:DUF1634 domain-containing protein n=1 Tax=Microseira wollei NIES-4236 TaxID=2530354 RepID=A0AAV3X4R9_9CYAN|nr:DUF1634 domain-containing protein [Microseira wollei]GET36166.1 hypothetical protein MiSe_09140 [Microseira wollei NIES-4236]